MESCPELLDGRGAVVDVGYGESPVTTLEFARAVRLVTPSLRVVGVERVSLSPPSAAGSTERWTSGSEAKRKIRQGEATREAGERVGVRGRAHSTAESRDTELVEGDFTTCASLAPTAVVRAMNVLRGYREEEVPAIHAALGAGLVEGGIVLEGSTDTEGHVLVSHVLRRRGEQLVREALLFHTDFARGFSPWLFRDWLPRDLRRRAVPGSAIHGLFTRWDAQAKSGPPDPKARFVASVAGVVEATEWELRHGFARWVGCAHA